MSLLLKAIIGFFLINGLATLLIAAWKENLQVKNKSVTELMAMIGLNSLILGAILFILSWIFVA